MNGREKIEAALSPEGTPEIGVVIPYEGIYVRDHWTELTYHPWWVRFSPDISQQLAWREQVVTAIGQDWLSLPVGSSRVERREQVIEARPQGVYLVNRRTGRATRLRQPEVGGWEAFALPAGPAGLPATRPEELERAIPAPEPFDRRLFKQAGRGELAEALLAEFGARLYPLGDAASPLWRCYSVWGFEGLMEMIAARPALVKGACQRFLAHELRNVQEAAALGARGIWIEECLTDMISPQAFEELNLPYLRALVEEIRALGMQSIYYYCGNPANRLPLLISSGAEALALEESKKGFHIDIAEVAEAVQGRCALLGNLDALSLLPQASEAQLRDEIARQIAAGRKNGSRFVMSLGSPVTPETRPERVRLYCALAGELGRE
jgi:hypothetical protein